jgi:mono/diheme cytochrome c family protein
MSSQLVRKATGVALRATPATHSSPLTALLFISGSLLFGACHRDMRDQPRYETLEASRLFADGMSARTVPKGTVPRGRLAENQELETGRTDGGFVEQIPLPLDPALVTRGQERFNIFCSPCHGRTAAGDGMIVRRGFRQPPSFHIDRLRKAPAGHFFDVMTRGFGAMPAYGAHIAPRDRWAIVAYVRALQLSQNATLDDVPADERAALTEAQP